jgi:hypothetical protein
LLGCGFGKALTLKKCACCVHNPHPLLELVALSPPGFGNACRFLDRCTRLCHCTSPVDETDLAHKMTIVKNEFDRFLIRW